MREQLIQPPQPSLHVFDATTAIIPSSSDTKLYRVRRSHPKSRGGCEACKFRRVKCDETRPQCGACRRRDQPCSYNAVSNGLAALGGRPRFLWPGKKSPLVLCGDGGPTHPNTFSSDDDFEMIRHFDNVVGRYVFGPSDPWGAINVAVRRIAREHQHVMHAIIAASALHIRLTSNCAAYNTLQTNHWLRASATFRSGLQTQDWSENADPLITSCMLLNLLSFADETSNDHQSSSSSSSPYDQQHRWPLAAPATNPAETETKPLHWLTIQLGFGPLLCALSQRAFTTSIWKPMFLASQPASTLPPNPDDFFSQTSEATNPYHSEEPGTGGIPPSYTFLFDITASSTCEAHPYLRIVRRVLPLLDLPSGDDSTLLYLQFVQGLTPRFIGLLESRDPRAVLLFAMWMALLCGTTHWWARGRVRGECWRCVRFLDCIADDSNHIITTTTCIRRFEEPDNDDHDDNDDDDGEAEDNNNNSDDNLGWILREIRSGGWLDGPAMMCGFVLQGDWIEAQNKY